MTTGTPGEKKPLRFPLHTQIILALLLGLVVGPLLGTGAKALGELGKLTIQLIRAAATPLLFFAIVNAILGTEIRGRAALRLLFWATVNASIALTIGLLISNLFQPGHHLARVMAPNPEAVAAFANKKVDLIETLSSFVPTNLITPFAENLILTVILIAVLTGAGLRRVRSEQLALNITSFQALEGVLATLQRLTEVVLGWVIRLVPFAVFGVVAKSVAEHGYAPLKGLAAYVGVGVGGLLVHVLFTYHLWLVVLVRMPLSRFWSAAKEPVAYAAGANSSLATLPVTLRALDRLGVSRSSSALGACVGTNLNNDGIILYEGMAVLFVAQASGIDLSLGEQLLAAVTCMVAAVGVAGVPEAGFVSLAVVLNTVGLPVELLPLLLTVDWIIARGRSMVNVLSDMLLSLLIDRGQSSATPPNEPRAALHQSSSPDLVSK